jgi:hypothetical protein
MGLAVFGAAGLSFYSSVSPCPCHPSLSLTCFCRGIGDLVLVYKRITGLAGHTSRVGELIEQVGGRGAAQPWLLGEQPAALCCSEG